MQQAEAVASFKESFDAMRDVRSLVLKSLEDLRGQGVIKHSLDAAVVMHIASTYKYAENINALFALIRQQGHSVELFLKEYFIVSQIVVANTPGAMQEVTPGLFEKAEGGKCARCWQWEVTGKFDEVKQLCQRCNVVLQ
jgi:isoleucyl-tRNA synthetase